MADETSLSRFRMSRRSEIFMHLETSNAAFYFIERIAKREEAGDHEGLKFDYWACALLIAYWQEALLAFFAIKTGSDPDQKISFWKELEKANEKFGLELAEGSDRRNTINDLRDIRNGIAHGKIITEVGHVEFVATMDEAAEKYANLRNEPWEWENKLTLEFLRKVFDLSNALEQRIYQGLGLDRAEVFSGVERSLHRVGPAK